jgi:hypothetical protein
MTVSSTTTKVSYAGNGATTVFAYTFKIFAAADLEVVLRSAAGVEAVQTITTHYTVSGAGADAGGNVTFVTAPASGVTVIIRRALALTQGTDYVENDPFPANSHEDALDRLTFITQQMQEELDRSIKASVTNTISTVEFSTSAADRANKLFSFDSSGDLQISQELGTYRGNWSASTLYYQRDIIKDTSNNNIYLANTQHTSTGAQPISSNADVAKWDLIVDAAAAATSATNAANSATAAATSETNAATSASNAATSETNAGPARQMRRQAPLRLRLLPPMRPTPHQRRLRRPATHRPARLMRPVQRARLRPVRPTPQVRPLPHRPARRMRLTRRLPPPLQRATLRPAKQMRRQARHRQKRRRRLSTGTSIHRQRWPTQALVMCGLTTRRLQASLRLLCLLLRHPRATLT